MKKDRKPNRTLILYLRQRRETLMDLMNLKVSHKVFGDGIIIDNDSSYITVKFSEGEKKVWIP